MKDIVSDCFLCGEHSLHVVGKEEAQIMQCINCGYVTSTKFIGTKETNEEYKKLPKDMKEWAVEKQNRIWIPSIMTLPIGMLYPVNIDNMVNHKTEMKWAFAPMVKISEDEKENYKKPDGGYYEKKIDTDNPKIYEEFFEAMMFVNENLKKHEKSTDVKLPKLNKINEIKNINAQ
jgi:hypothetical protein